jgi:hypothetical protein
MFFIGLAGSFMPYLLFLGVLFVLTLGIGKGHEPELVADTEKTIEYQKPDNAEENLLQSSYFYHSGENRHARQSQKSFTCPPSVRFFAFKLTSKTPVFFVCQQYSFEVYHTFFGLSPPVLIS